MPRDGNGTYSLPEAPFVPNTLADANAVNSDLSDIASAISQSLSKDGQTTATAAMNWGGFRQTNVGSASVRTDAPNLGQVQDGAFLDAGETGGTSTAYTATLSPSITAYADKQCFRVKFDQACGANPTINFNSVGAKKIYKNVSGTPVQLEAADVPDDYVAFLRYDSTLDSSAGGFLLLNLPFELSAGIITPVELASASISEITNLTLEATVGSDALTIAIKGQDGNDPSADNPVKIPFADPSGGVEVLTLTSATALTVSSGSTLGTTSGVASRLWIVGFNDGGTFRLGVVNADLGGGVFQLTEDNVYSATDEGGAGGADSAGVIYSDAAITDKPIRILGYVKSTQATAGAWVTAPSKVTVWQKGARKPGEITMVGWDEYLDATTVSITAGSWVAFPNLSVDDVEVDDGETVIILAQLSVGATVNNKPLVRAMRDSTVISNAINNGSRIPAVAALGAFNGDVPRSGFVMAFDTPGAGTYDYSFQITAPDNITAYINRSSTDTNSNSFIRFTSRMMVVKTRL